MRVRLSRRHFLKGAGLGAAALASNGTLNVLAQDIDNDGIPDIIPSYNEIYGNPPLLGRVHGASWIRIFKGPAPSYGSVRQVFWGYVMPIYRSVRGEPYDHKAVSDVWFETDEGYVHSAYVVPSHEQLQDAYDIPGSGLWGEIMAPLVTQYRNPSFTATRWTFAHYRGYYGQVHRVLERTDDEQGNGWYRIYDDIEPNRQAWIPAKFIRLVGKEEFAPISPEVTDKKIVIDLGQQMITCYEASRQVFKTRIASGTSLTSADGVETDFSTPYGEYNVQRKRPSRRMRGGESFNLPYDVNGVPWVTYFTYTGAAIHGAYWHNNYGLPRSHGCINITPDAAKWVYRWSQPYLTYDEDYRWVEEGELATPIEII